MESIKMFAMCEQMKWAHLPVAGGLYDQHPVLLEQWRYIFGVRNEHEQKKMDEQKREQELAQRKAGSQHRPSSRAPRRR